MTSDEQMSHAESPPLDEDRARELLSRERERIERSLEDLERDRRGELEEIDTATDPDDDAELIEETQVDAALAEQLQGELEGIERAEARLREGAYGLSIESGKPIPARRLETIPWAERTAEEQERADGR
jgi:RNA polymerase-binding transcription factor